MEKSTPILIFEPLCFSCFLSGLQNSALIVTVKTTTAASVILGYDATAAPNVNNQQLTANSSVLSNFRSIVITAQTQASSIQSILSDNFGLRSRSYVEECQYPTGPLCVAWLPINSNALVIVNTSPLAFAQCCAVARNSAKSVNVIYFDPTV